MDIIDDDFFQRSGMSFYNLPIEEQREAEDALYGYLEEEEEVGREYPQYNVVRFPTDTYYKKMWDRYMGKPLAMSRQGSGSVINLEDYRKV